MDEGQCCPTDRTVSKEDLKQAYDGLGKYVKGVLDDRPLTMADGPDGENPQVGSIIGTLLIGIGALAIGKKVLS